MILIADSGSTKCDWVLIKSNSDVIEFNTMGFNPFFHSEELISTTLNDTEAIAPYKDKIKYIFYYGAGSSTKNLKQVLHRALESVFINADHIYSDHDLVAAALATYDDEPCISCILGTGSNSCFYNGDIVSQETPSLGYILGDEGSGSFFGKKLLTRYMYKDLPEELSNAFQKEFGLTKEVLFENVYRKDNANVYLASFMKFLSDNRKHPFVHEFITSGFFEFMSIHVLCFDNYKEVPVHFVGSVAFYFEDMLRKVAQSLEVKVGKIIKKPIDGLLNYHLKHSLPKLEQ